MIRIIDLIFFSEKCVFCKGWYDVRSMSILGNSFSGKKCVICDYISQKIEKIDL